MKKLMLVVVLAAFATITALAAKEAAKKAEPKVTKTTVLYACANYGTCGQISLTEVKCRNCFQWDLQPQKVLAVKDGCALCCNCGADCKCTLEEGDATKCTCGKDVNKYRLKGMFVCEKCCVISDKEGKCPLCGENLQAVVAPEVKADETKAAEPKAPEAVAPTDVKAPEANPATAVKASEPKDAEPEAPEANPAP